MLERIEQLFGVRVRELRIELGLTQEQLAERAQIHRTYLASVEAGRRNISIVNVVYLARGLGVAPSELFTTFTAEVLKQLPANSRNQSRARKEK